MPPHILKREIAHTVFDKHFTSLHHEVSWFFSQQNWQSNLKILKWGHNHKFNLQCSLLLRTMRKSAYSFLLWRLFLWIMHCLYKISVSFFYLCYYTEGILSCMWHHLYYTNIWVQSVPMHPWHNYLGHWVSLNLWYGWQVNIAQKFSLVFNHPHSLQSTAKKMTCNVSGFIKLNSEKCLLWALYIQKNHNHCFNCW